MTDVHSPSLRPAGDITSTATGFWEQLHSLTQVLPLLRIPWRRVMWAALLGSITIGASVGLAAVSAWLIVRASQMPPVLDLTVATVSVRALGISRGVFRYLERLASHDVALRGVVELRDGLYLRLADQPSPTFAQHRRGEVLARLSHDVDALSDFVVKSLIPVVIAVVSGIGSVVLLAFFSWQSALVLAAMLFITTVITPLSTAWATWRSDRASLTAVGEINAVSTTVIGHSGDLTVNGDISGIWEELAGAEARLDQATDRRARPMALAHGIHTLAMGVSVVGALIIAIPQATSGDVAAVELAILVLTPLAAFEASSTLAAAGSETARASEAARRVLALTDATPSPHSASGEPTIGARSFQRSKATLTQADQHPLTPNPMGLPASACPSDASITLLDGTIGWPGGPPILARLSLSVPARTSLVVVGPSGSGKSTLLQTLAGIIRPQKGQVFIGDADPSQLAESERAALVVFSAEDSHIFATSVLENLRLGRGDLSPDEAADLLEKVGLARWLEHLPEGIDTLIEPGAANLSGGERRRLIIARALATRAPVLLFDEPAEHLDTGTSAALLRDIIALSAERTIVVVTHQRAGTETADHTLDMRISQ